MAKENPGPAVVSPETSQLPTNPEASPRKAVNRRSFMKGSMVAGAATMGAGILAGRLPAFAETENSSSLTTGDIAILRFVAAAEIIETDLWQQYAELGGLSAGKQNPYQKAFQRLDGDGSQYITSNTLDEQSHAEFLNAYLISKGAEPVDFDAFRTLPSSQASGAQQIGRLTNLMNLTVDTSWFTRYRSALNPDFGATFPQAINLVNVTAIPQTDADFAPANHIQAIANTAAFHFGTIEQGGSTLYSAMAQKASNLEVLRIVVSIGGDEVAHFLEWVDFAGNGVQPMVAPFTDSISGLSFPNFFANPPLQPPSLVQPSLIFPVPCEFISPNLPHVAIIRPLTDRFAGAVATVAALTANGLFTGQSRKFLNTIERMAIEADNAVRLAR